MSGIDSNHTDPPANSGSHEGNTYDKEPCPLCGTEVKLLPPHFRSGECDAETGGFAE